MRNTMMKSIMIVLFSIFLTACGSKEPLSEDVSVEITMQGVEADINEDVDIGTLLSRTLLLNNVTVPITDVTIALSGVGSEDFNVTLEAGATVNSYIGKVALLNTLDGKGGTTYELNATATVNGQSVEPVPIMIHIIDIPKQALVMLCDEVNGTEPWITDGTTEGTRVLANLNPEGNSLFYSAPVKIDDIFYVSLDDGTHGATLWKSDGSGEGTTLVKDINDTGTNDQVRNLTVAGETLFFSAYGKTLYKSDGSRENTHMIKEIKASEISFFTSYHDKVYFLALDGDYGSAELWESNGTSAGTQFVVEIPDITDKPRGLTVIGDTLYVGIPNNTTKTILIKKADMTSIPLSFEDDETLTNAGLRWMGVYRDKLHLITIDLVSFHSGIWKKEADSYTKLPLDIDFDFGDIQVFDNLFLFDTFRMDEDSEGRYMQLWKSDTTEDGSEMIKETLCAGYPT